MKKFLLTVSLVIACTSLARAQSRLSYSLLVNQSASTDNYHTVCLFTGNGNPCLILDKAWKTNLTFNANYELSPRLRLQAGLGYNVMHMDKLNGVLATNRYQVEFLSIPVKAHYFIKNHGKARLYIGTGVRTDIRLTQPVSDYSLLAIVADNSRSISASLEVLVGIEIPLSSRIKLNIEPTYGTAITRYSRETGIELGIPGSVNRTPYALIDEYPGRYGISVGFTFRL